MHESKKFMKLKTDFFILLKDILNIEHTSTHIQKHGKHIRSGVLLKYLTVYPCLLITWILNTPVIYTS